MDLGMHIEIYCDDIAFFADSADLLKLLLVLYFMCENEIDSHCVLAEEW